MPCMRAGGTLELCRALATPKVRACVAAAMGRPANAGAGAHAAGQTRSAAGPAVGKARSLIQQGKYPEAVAELDRAVKQDPNFTFAYAWRGVAKVRMQQFNEAMTDLNEALKLDPRNVLALGQRGYVFFLLRDNGKGLADVNAALEIDSTAAAPYAFRGLIYSDMGDQDKALADLNRAVKLNPDSSGRARRTGIGLQQAAGVRKIPVGLQQSPRACAKERAVSQRQRLRLSEPRRV